MPYLFMDPAGHMWREPYGYREGFAALEDTESALKQMAPGRDRPPLEGQSDGDIFHTRKIEAAPGLPFPTPGEQDPAPHVVLEMVRLHGPFRGLVSLRRVVGKKERAVSQQGLGHLVEYAGIAW